MPGSFDPMTLGHRDIVLRALELYDVVYVAIMQNAEKKERFTSEERHRIAELTLSGTAAKVLVGDGYTADLARSLGACALVKGIRNSVDFEYEKAGEDFNRARFPECETVYLRSRDEFAAISSTEAYRRLMSGENTDGYLCETALEYIKGIVK